MKEYTIIRSVYKATVKKTEPLIIEGRPSDILKEEQKVYEAITKAAQQLLSKVALGDADFEKKIGMAFTSAGKLTWGGFVQIRSYSNLSPEVKKRLDETYEYILVSLSRIENHFTKIAELDGDWPGITPIIDSETTAVNTYEINDAIDFALIVAIRDCPLKSNSKIRHMDINGLIQHISLPPMTSDAMAEDDHKELSVELLGINTSECVAQIIDSQSKLANKLIYNPGFEAPLLDSMVSKIGLKIITTPHVQYRSAVRSVKEYLLIEINGKFSTGNLTFDGL